MASTGMTCAASKEGASAASREMPMPTTSPDASDPNVNSTGPGSLLTYRDWTVDPNSVTAPSAMKRPSNNPMADPAAAKKAASARKPVRMIWRVAPNARKMPISLRRRTTEMEMVL